MRERKRFIVQLCIQLSPFYFYFCILLFVMSGVIPSVFLEWITNFFPFILLISVIGVESVYAYLHHGRSLSEVLSHCEFNMNETSFGKQMFRVLVLEGILPYLLIFIAHTLGYLTFIFVNEISRYLHPLRKTLIELLMQGEWVKKTMIEN